jgi:hypothetical protein
MFLKHSKYLTFVVFILLSYHHARVLTIVAVSRDAIQEPGTP